MPGNALSETMHDEEDRIVLVGSVTMVWLTTEVNDQSSSTVQLTVVMSDHVGVDMQDTVVGGQRHELS